MQVDPESRSKYNSTNRATGAESESDPMPRTTPAQEREITRAFAAARALREIGAPERADTFVAAIGACITCGAHSATIRALADEIDAAYRATAAANAKGGNQ